VAKAADLAIQADATQAEWLGFPWAQRFPVPPATRPALTGGDAFLQVSQVQIYWFFFPCLAFLRAICHRLEKLVRLEVRLIGMPVHLGTRLEARFLDEACGGEG
jgi:hypothetical protein